MANKQRGEVEIELGGMTFKLVPDFTAICEIEDKAGLGVNLLALKFAANNFAMKDVAAVVYGGLIGGGHTEFSFRQVGEMVRKHGFFKIVKPASEFLQACMTGDPVDQKEQEEAARKNEGGAEVTSAPKTKRK